jgi:hypothetical protein
MLRSFIIWTCIDLYPNSRSADGLRGDGQSHNADRTTDELFESAVRKERCAVNGANTSGEAEQQYIFIARECRAKTSFRQKRSEHLLVALA